MDREAAFFAISLLKKNSYILNTAFNKENFDYRALFIVLNSKNINL
jgi:hypothetical protein